MLKSINFYLTNPQLNILWTLYSEPLPFTISTHPPDPIACPTHGIQINVTRTHMLERKSQVSFILSSQGISWFTSDTIGWSLRMWYTKTSRHHVRFLSLTCWYPHALMSRRKTVAYLYLDTWQAIITSQTDIVNTLASFLVAVCSPVLGLLKRWCRNIHALCPILTQGAA
jgi:hypothetical protein